MPSVFQTTVVSCSNGVAPTNPTRQALNFVGGRVRVIRIVIPAGHAGLTGIALGFGGNAVLPLNSGGYYSGDDRHVEFAYDDNNQGVQWQAFMCNGDGIGHVWEVDFDIDPAADNNSTSVIVPLAPSDILSVGNVAANG